MIRVERTENLKTTQYLRERWVNNVTRFYASQACVESRALGRSVTAWNQLPSAAYTCVNIEIFGWSPCDLYPALQPQERQPPASLADLHSDKGHHQILPLTGHKLEVSCELLSLARASLWLSALTRDDVALKNLWQMYPTSIPRGEGTCQERDKATQLRR